MNRRRLNGRAGPALAGCSAWQLWVCRPQQASTDPTVHEREPKPCWAPELSLVTEGPSELARPEGRTPDLERHPACMALQGPPGTAVPCHRRCVHPSAVQAWSVGSVDLFLDIFQILAAEVCS